MSQNFSDLDEYQSPKIPLDFDDYQSPKISLDLDEYQSPRIPRDLDHYQSPQIETDSLSEIEMSMSIWSCCEVLN